MCSKKLSHIAVRICRDHRELNRTFLGCGVLLLLRVALPDLLFFDLPRPLPLLFPFLLPDLALETDEFLVLFVSGSEELALPGLFFDFRGVVDLPLEEVLEAPLSLLFKALFIGACFDFSIFFRDFFDDVDVFDDDRDVCVDGDLDFDF